MDGKNATTNLLITEGKNRKNREYTQLKISISLCAVMDVICASNEYDTTTKEWYGNDENWGV